MIIRLTESEMFSFENIIKNLNGGTISSNGLMKVLKHDAKDDKPAHYEIKIRKDYTEPVLKTLSRYSGFLAPMVRSGVEMVQAMAHDIEDIETSVEHTDKVDVDSTNGKILV